MKYNIILGSGSPRRRELLSGLDIDFTVRTIAGIEESYPDNIQGKDVPEFLANLKADAYTLEDNDLLITADTVVLLDDAVLGKPANGQAAIDMLHLLSGRTHEVITGVAVRTKERKESFSAATKVTFSTLTDEEIRYYINKYRPFDKAGSYGVQEWIGYIGVSAIEGSYYNVMGLPIQRLYSLLKQFGVFSI